MGERLFETKWHGLRIALVTALSGGVAFHAGYLRAIPRNALHFLDAISLVNITTLPVLLIGIAWTLGIVIHRWASNEIFREVTTLEQITSRPLIGALIFFIGFLWIHPYIFGNHLMQNWKWPVCLIMFFYFHFFLYGPTAVNHSLRSHLLALSRIARRRTQTFLLIMSRDLIKFVRFNSIVIVFVLGSWAVFSRGEYLSADAHFILRSDDVEEQVIGPILEARSGSVFILRETRAVAFFTDFRLLEDKEPTKP